MLYNVSCDEDLYRGHANVGVFCYSHAIGIDLLKNPSKKLGKISINACSPHKYNVERDEVRVELYFPNKSTHPIKYDKEKLAEELRKHLTRDVEMEPV